LIFSIKLSPSLFTTMKAFTFLFNNSIITPFLVKFIIIKKI
jgi:hypothetical protein